MLGGLSCGGGGTDTGEGLACSFSYSSVDGFAPLLPPEKVPCVSICRVQVVPDAGLLEIFQRPHRYLQLCIPLQEGGGDGVEGIQYLSGQRHGFGEEFSGHISVGNESGKAWIRFRSSGMTRTTASLVEPCPIRLAGTEDWHSHREKQASSERLTSQARRRARHRQRWSWACLWWYSWFRD